MADVVAFPGQTILPLSADKVLAAAAAKNLSQVIVIGLAEDGPYHAATTSDIPDILFRMEMFKRQLLERAAKGAG